MKRKIKHIFLTTLLVALFLCGLNNAPFYAQEQNFGLMIPQEVVDYWENRDPDLQNFQLGDFLSEVDWSDNDSEVKNQSSCGSCWAFAATALVENLSAYENLSEQVLVSCATGNCSGGWYGDALQYIHDSGIPSEVCYPYLGTNGNCEDQCDNPKYVVKVNNYDYYARWGLPNSSTVNNLKNLLQTSPVLVSMLVPADGTFSGYTGGIYNYDGSEISSSRGHAVLVVGYNEQNQYFKAKNSWGSSWGESGYFRIAYDDVTDDVQFGGYACIASGVYTSQSTPVELASFSANVKKNDVEIMWATRSETENYGFDIEKSSDGISYEKVGFIKGCGTTSIPQTYFYTDQNVSVGDYYYRLKQIDFDGQISYSKSVKVNLNPPDEYSLNQNFPNPFNNNTKINFQLPAQRYISLKIYNVIGQEVKALIQRSVGSGYHSVIWDGSNSDGHLVNTGIYYYRLEAGDFNSTKRLVYIK